jgi:hypothetical protein
LLEHRITDNAGRRIGRLCVGLSRRTYPLRAWVYRCVLRSNWNLEWSEWQHRPGCGVTEWSLTAIVENSPFTRIVSISDSLVLTGMAYVDGKPVVTIFDKTAKQSIVVSDEPNLKGWKLVGAQPAEKIDFAQAKIAIGGETFSIRHTSLSKDDMRKDKSERREGGPGGPPPPGGGDRFSRSNKGPSEEDRKKYESLSEKARDKFRNALREKFSDEKFRNAPEEDRRNALRSIFEKIEKEDKGGK